MSGRSSSLLLAVLIAVPSVANAQSNFAVFGGTSAKLGSGARIINGDAGSNGVLTLGANVSVAGSTKSDTLSARPNVHVFGNGFFNHLVAHGTPQPQFSGGTSPIALPVLTMPPPTVNPGTQTFDFGSNHAFVINPGRYDFIHAGSGTTIILNPGQYDMNELIISGGNVNTTIRCNIGTAPCLVRVQSRLKLAAMRVGGTDSNTARGPLTFEYAGTESVAFGRPGVIVEADISAPLAKVKLKSSRRIPGEFTGHFLGASVTVGGNARVQTAAPAPPVCGDGVVQGPSESCDPPVDFLCPGTCLPDCTCPPPPGLPALHSIGPSVLNNATAFGVQVFGAGFVPGAQLELSDASTSSVLATLPTTFVSQGELTARVPAGLPVPSGMQRELTARVINPGNFRSAAPDIGHCTTDTPTSPIACTSDADCPSGTAPCVTGTQRLTLFNDLVFLNPNSAALVPAPRGLCDNGTRCQSVLDCVGIGSGACSPKLYVTPQQRDELWVFNTGTRQFVDQNGAQSGIQGIPVGDNPFHVEMLDLGAGSARAWVVNRFDDSFSIIDPATDTEVARVTGAALGIPGRLRMETEIEFNRAHTRAYLSNENVDEVQVLDISGSHLDAPVLVGTIDVGVNPRGMATNATDTRLYVANIQSADVSIVDITSGSPTENQVVKTVAARATDDIVGGRADGWEAFVIGGRAPRGIAYSAARNAVYISSIGPQTGPRAGVGQVGGAIINPTITVIDATTETVVAHVALNGLDGTRPSCSDPELLAVDDVRSRLYVTCQGSGTVDVLDTIALTAGLPAELMTLPIPLPTDATVPTLALNPQAGAFGAKVCAAFTSTPGTPCTSGSQCGTCPTQVDGVPVVCCALNNPIGLHNGPRGLALAADGSHLFVVNQFTTSVATLDTSSVTPAFVGVTSFPGAFGSDTAQRDRRLGQIEFFTDLKKTNISCATCHIDDHQDGVFFEADVQGPRLRRVLSVRSTRDFPPLLQDQLLPDLTAFTDVVVHVERGGAVCTPCTELNGVFTCFPSPEGTCTMTSNSEAQQNTAYAKGVTFFPNPNLSADGSLSTSVPLPGGRTGDAIRGEAVFDQLACQTCHPEPLFTLDQFRVFNLNGFSSVQSVRMREAQTPVILPLRAKCQDANRPTGADGSTGFGVPTLRGIWDTFPLLMSGSAGLQVVGPEPAFSPSCTPGTSGCCAQLHSPINSGGIAVPEQHLGVGSKDALRAMLTPPLAVPGSGHGAALALSQSDLDALIAYLRSL